VHDLRVMCCTEVACVHVLRYSKCNEELRTSTLSVTVFDITATSRDRIFAQQVYNDNIHAGVCVEPCFVYVRLPPGTSFFANRSIKLTRRQGNFHFWGTIAQVAWGP